MLGAAGAVVTLASCGQTAPPRAEVAKPAPKREPAEPQKPRCESDDCRADVAPAEPARPALPEHLSFLLISVDTLRPDLGYTGYTRPISPNIDELAKRSTVYERAY